ncbi:DUF4959 domain-containing protein [Chitinophagaceae bacterium LB-8]|uniref:DUF4959 domain-containing protein n=1 Tax=Paraflavisolibacter caeni TaxID=2982496 RepID=A0A9X3BHU9_9BACT|nr:DUF4959 domain-containing protein [Paraflavisolibacter caeni]MCU7550222.1 DUF4959 domain-containing protein [Paraflavisolibacter caeni]
MNFSIKHLILFVTAFVALQSCQKDEGHQPVSSDQSIPVVVSNVQVENRPGKAKITYSIPSDKNLLYVKAEYLPSSGELAETKASYYQDSLILEGFADTLEHEVKLYSVSRSGVQSAPVVIKIKPLEAPIWQVFKSINIVNAFGGFNLTASNPTGDNISIVVLTKNVFKEYEINNNMSVFTNEKNILNKVKGMDTVTTRLGFLVKDRWGNTTDTMYRDINPIFETQLNPVNFRGVVLPGDAPQVTNGAKLEYAWDNRLGWPYTSFTHQVNGGPQPHMITFDMGITAKLSRIWIRPYPEGTRYYFLTTMKRFEIYGSDNPSTNGTLDNSWTLLGSYEVVKPSGLPYGTDNALDQATASAGFNWEIRLDAPKVKFLRIRCLENFAGGTAQSINELKVYGDPR